MKVLLNNKETHKPEVVEATLVKETQRTVWVKLLDGNIIKRKKSTQIPKEG